MKRLESSGNAIMIRTYCGYSPSLVFKTWDENDGKAKTDLKVFWRFRLPCGYDFGVKGSQKQVVKAGCPRQPCQGCSDLPKMPKKPNYLEGSSEVIGVGVERGLWAPAEGQDLLSGYPRENRPSPIRNPEAPVFFANLEDLHSAVQCNKNC